MPLFSVILPTKDRKSLALENVRHSLALGWEDMEFVVVDNSNDDETSKALSEIKDFRLKIVRTGGLSMADNWEQGFKSASGDYFFIMGDKGRLHADALPIIADRIGKYHPEVLSFDARTHWRPTELFQYDDDNWSVVDSKKIIEFILDVNFLAMHRFCPVGYQALYSKSLIRSIQAKYGRVIFPIAADFTAGLSAIFNTESVHHYFHPLLSVVPGVSAGWSAYYGGNLAERNMNDLGMSNPTTLTPFEDLPIFTPANSYLCDIVKISKLMRQELTLNDFNVINLICFLYDTLMVSHGRFHLDVSKDLRILYQFIEDRDLFGNKKIEEMLNKFDNTLHGNRNTSVNPSDILFMMRNLWLSLGLNNNTRIAIYGAGKHTHWLEKAVHGISGPKVVSLIDELGNNASPCFNITPIPLHEFNSKNIDAVLISSDVPAVIKKMQDNLRPFCSQKLKVIIPYEKFPPGPYAKLLLYD